MNIDYLILRYWNVRDNVSFLSFAKILINAHHRCDVPLGIFS